MEVGEKVIVYKSYLGTKSEYPHKVLKTDEKNIWVNDYEFPFSLKTGEYSQMTIEGFKIFIMVKN